jgi:hypothetical protein
VAQVPIPPAQPLHHQPLLQQQPQHQQPQQQQQQPQHQQHQAGFNSQQEPAALLQQMLASPDAIQVCQLLLSSSLTLSLKHWLIVHLFVAIFFDVLGFETWVPFFCGLGSSKRSKQASTASGAASKVDYSSTGAVFFSLLHIDTL